MKKNKKEIMSKRFTTNLRAKIQPNNLSFSENLGTFPAKYLKQFCNGIKYLPLFAETDVGNPVEIRNSTLCCNFRNYCFTSYATVR